MSSNAAYKKYKETSITSASKEKLLLMMYEGAIKFIKKAKLDLEQNNISGKCENIGRAYDIILELNNTLDHKVGGDVASQLEQLYMFMTEQLIKANISNDSNHLDSVLKILETLYEGWKQAVDKIKK